MDHYLEIHLLPDPEFPATMLMSALVGKVHRGLVEYGNERIGVSFPDIRVGSGTLGKRLRLHGAEADLKRLMEADWTQGMRDHIEVGEVVDVPENTKHRIVRRVQAKSSPERLRRRLIARKQIGEEEARQAIPDSAAKKLALPHVVLASKTTGQRFKLFIEHLPIQDDSISGRFGAYGLSPTTTIPWF